jgi:hypothetical protein
MKFSPLIPKRLSTAAVALITAVCGSNASAATRTIVHAPDAPPRILFAAREVQRYVYLRTGEIVPIAAATEPPAGEAIVVAETGQRLAAAAPFVSAAERAGLAPECYLLRSESGGRLWIIGGDDLGTLYGAYRFSEHLGVRFYLHGDVIPDAPAAGAWPALDETGRPLFGVRGLQPFHDFAEGPDWWNRDDYFAVTGQMAKLRMNFIGLHTYPESSVGPEPTVWLGLPGEYDERGRVRIAYPASYHTTGRSGRQWWGYSPLPTSEFTGGAAELFDRDDFGGEVMRDHVYAAQTPESAAEVFNRTADLLREAFTEARRLGLKTCVGTETPLTLPAALKDRVAARGLAADDPTLAGEIYHATFERIARAYPIDYYWLWTPEGWTWEGNKPEQFAATASDIRAALGALERLGHPFTLATCGWVLGPQHDRAALDQLLPPGSPMSAINQSVGHRPIELQFANLSQRPRWAIPWLENDGALIQPQLWAGRMRYDAADARRLGCDGLLGIHWRTRVLAPNVAALASAAWDQSWLPPSFDPSPIPPQTASGAIGGQATAITDAPPDAGILASVRVGMSAYEIPVPNGVYAITLAFAEPGDARPGERVFAVQLDGTTLLDRVDPAAAPGRTLIETVRDRKINAGKLRLDFLPIAGQPVIAGIEIAGTTEVNATPYQRRINCGGPAWEGYEADLLPGTARPDEARSMPVEEFYRDFAVANFGAKAGPAIGAIFARMDGKLHQTIGWMDGPGGIMRHAEPWSTLAPQYAFIDDLQALRADVRGAGNLARFDSWLAQFRFYRALAQIGCAAGALDLAVERVAREPESTRPQLARTQLLPMRLALARAWEALLALQIAATDTTGELGILANLEQHNRVQQRFLTRHDESLVAWLGGPLPMEAVPTSRFDGPDRIIVPTVRTSAHAGEPVTVRVILVGASTPTQAELLWRPMGRGEYQRIPLEHRARRVFEGTLPALTPGQSALEYRVEARMGDGQAMHWPASESGTGQTLVLFDGE